MLLASPVAPPARALNWPAWADCHTAAQYPPNNAQEVVTLTSHPTLAAVHFCPSAAYMGGAIILEAHSGGVMALEYHDDATLAAEWRSTRRHYAPGRKGRKP